MPPTRLKPLALVNHSCAGFDDIPFRVVGGEDKNTFDLINSPGGDMPVCQFHGAKAHSERMTRMLAAQPFVASAMIRA